MQRCDELLAVGQPSAAFNALGEIFTSKKFRITPLSVLEPVLLRFVELGVDLRRTQNIKEGLHSYKNIAQNTSVASVETVFNHFLTKSKQKLDDALRSVDVDPDAPRDAQGDGLDVDDLESADTAETLMLMSVSEEKGKDKSYRTVVTPWLRFLWSAYRTTLDLLRNNPRLEVLYQVRTLFFTLVFCGGSLSCRFAASCPRRAQLLLEV
jgi:translation initiation factor 3 subunit A